MKISVQLTKICDGVRIDADQSIPLDIDDNFVCHSDIKKLLISKLVLPSGNYELVKITNIYPGYSFQDIRGTAVYKKLESPKVTYLETPSKLELLSAILLSGMIGSDKQSAEDQIKPAIDLAMTLIKRCASTVQVNNLN